MLPEALRESYRPLLLASDEEVRRIVKAADKLSATSSASKSSRPATVSSRSAAGQTRQALDAMALPELNWFLETCLYPLCGRSG